ncbi:hypothetical protein, partial [Streptomyces sp. NPDC059378]|uniref:hypothetical protein n=1 Tax=Streptomyces sp. NPDC059378 TaxID=3346815 RepID=UPI0036C3D8FC
MKPTAATTTSRMPPAIHTVLPEPEESSAAAVSPLAPAEVVGAAGGPYTGPGPVAVRRATRCWVP